MTITLAESAATFGLNTDEGNMSLVGPTLRRRRVEESASRKRAILHAASLLGDAWAGDKRAALRVEEALSTSDLFKSAAGDVFDRETLAQYQAMEPQWEKFATPTTVANFKPKYLRELSGARTKLERVPELTEYPSADYAVTEKTISVAKYGRRFGYSWEAAINDELGELKQVPTEFGTAARLTEEDAALALLVNTTTGAPNTAFFKAANNNIGTGALTAANLQAALLTLATKKDADGNPLARPQMKLIVGGALEFTAKQILQATQVKTVVSGTEYYGPNPLGGSVVLEVLPNMPGAAWFLVPVPNAPRPALYVAKLRGWETPDVRWQQNQGVGGQTGVDAGDFDFDGCYWRVRHVLGTAHGDPMFTYASTGV